MIWDAGPDCQHEWGDEIISIANDSNRGTMEWKTGGNPAAKVKGEKSNQGQFCQLCGCWRGCLGLEPTLELFISHIVEIFREVRRILRSDGTLFLNLGDSYAGSGSPGGDFRDGKGGDEYLRPYNRKGNSLKPKDLCGIPWRVALALQADGWWLRSDIIWHKPNPMPESVTDRPTKAHEYIFLLTKSAKYFYDAEAIREPHVRLWDADNGGSMATERHHKAHIGGTNRHKRPYPEPNPSGRNKRTVWTIATQPFPGSHFAVFPEKLIEPCVLAGTSEKGCCVECGGPWERVVEKTVPEFRYAKSDYPGNVTMATKKYKNDRGPESKTIGWEPTCKCGAEIVPCVVCDPFGGAMTTAIVAHKHGRKFIMIELSESYIKEIGIPRIESARTGCKPDEVSIDEGLNVKIKNLQLRLFNNKWPS
uniref:Putative methyltransferase n=1 Tax=viral metagenome TaxID=1070528 RepID=A0A6M3INB1_9ZZZZ